MSESINHYRAMSTNDLVVHLRAFKAHAAIPDLIEEAAARLTVATRGARLQALKDAQDAIGDLIKGSPR